MHACMYACMYVHKCIYTCVFMYYMCIPIHTHTLHMFIVISAVLVWQSESHRHPKCPRRGLDLSRPTHQATLFINTSSSAKNLAISCHFGAYTTAALRKPIECPPHPMPTLSEGGQAPGKQSSNGEPFLGTLSQGKVKRSGYALRLLGAAVDSLP